jgi:SAM-dependent methyltransferase
MNFSHKSKSKREIERLSQLGWTDASADSYGVRSFGAVNEETISFPSEKYELDANSQESKGVWAEFRARRIEEILKNHEIDLIWEVGAGHGNMAIPLASVGITTIPIEPLYSGARALSSHGFHVYAQTLDQLRLPSSSIEAVGIFDVIEHLPNPEIVLIEIHRILKPGGLLLTSVPAYQWLFSNFDLQIGHYRRYSRKSLTGLLESCEFRSTKISNLFFIFVLPAFVIRRLPYVVGVGKRNIAKVPTSENSAIHFLEPFLRVLLRAESKLGIPLGLSIISESLK